MVSSRNSRFEFVDTWQNLKFFMGRDSVLPSSVEAWDKGKGKADILGSGIKSQFCCVMLDSHLTSLSHTYLSKMT